MMPADASAERHPAKTGGGQVTLGVVSQNLWSTFFSLVGKDRYGRIRSFAEALSRLEQQVRGRCQHPLPPACHIESADCFFVPFRSTWYCCKRCTWQSSSGAPLYWAKTRWRC